MILATVQTFYDTFMTKIFTIILQFWNGFLTHILCNHLYIIAGVIPQIPRGFKRQVSARVSRETLRSSCLRHVIVTTM